MTDIEIKKEIERQMSIIKLGVEEIINEKELRVKLEKSIKNNVPLKIKLGIDPTGSDLHIGHAVPIRKLKQFQELGHEIYFLIGTFTGRIGDPTGKSETRKMLTEDDVKNNLKNYLSQLSKILDVNKINVVYNHEWLEKLKLEEFLFILSTITVSQMISREDFAKRLKENKPVSLVEFMYPVLQAYDSVALKADVELGATEQRFNVLKGRDLQRTYKQEEQVCVIMPILEGLDGVQKMSKSLNNYIGISDTPNDMFGKVMSVSDDLMLKYYDYLTDFSPEKIENIKKGIKDGSIHPMFAKKDLAEALVREYYGKEVAKEARNWFEEVFSNRNTNVDLEKIKVDVDEITIIELVTKYTNVYTSNSEARRNIQQGAVKIDNVAIKDINKLIKIKDGMVLRLGKKYIFEIGGKYDV